MPNAMSVWDDVPGLDYSPIFKNEWIDQDGIRHEYATLDAEDMTLCKRRRLNPKFENAFLKEDGTVKTDVDAIIPIQRMWLHNAYKPGGVMYTKIKSRFTSECLRQQSTSSSTK